MKRRFELVDGDSSKFWEVEVSAGRMTVRYGRIGTKGQTKVKELGAGATAAAEKLVAAKTKKGYREVGEAALGGADDEKTKAVIARLDAALASYAPEWRGSLRPAKRLGKLDKMVDVPASLRALWAWANGAEALIVPSAKSLDEALDLLSAADAARELAILRKAVAFPEALCPFAADGAGNFLVVNGNGAVLDWDHETRATRKVAPSIAALLARTEKALKKGVLSGGPELAPGELDKRVLAAEKLAAKPIAKPKTPKREIAKLREATALLGYDDSFRIRKMYLAKLRAAKVAQGELDGFLTSFALTAAIAGAWSDALAALDARGPVYERRDPYENVGARALNAGALKPAAKALAKGDSLAASVGRAVVAKLSKGSPAKHAARASKEVVKEIARMDAALKKDEAAGRKKPNPDSLSYLATLYVHRATLEEVMGNGRAAKKTLDEARARCGNRAKDCPRVFLDSYASAMGLS